MKKEEIVAIMLVKEYPEKDVGKFRLDSNMDGGLVLQSTPEREVEFYSEEDFKTPKRKNFEDFIEQVQSGTGIEPDVTVHFLKEATYENE